MVQLYSPDGGNVSSHNCTWWIRLNLYTIRPTEVHDQNGKSVGLTVSAQLMAESAYTLQWAPLSTRIAPFHRRIWTPSNTIPWAHASPRPKRHLDRFSRVLHTWPQSVHILYNGSPVSNSKLPLSMWGSGLYVIHGSLGPPESSTETASRSRFCRFCRAHLCDRPIDHGTRYNRPHVRT